MTTIPRSGQLDKRVTFRRCIDAAAGAFGIERSHADELRTWARKQNTSPAVYSSSVQTGDALTHEFTIRRRRSLQIGDGWEVVHGMTVYRVKRVLELAGGDYMLYQCGELGHGK